MQNQKTINQGRIETLNINQIKPYWRNPRINEKAVAAVKKSIDDFGYNQFIVVDKENVIICGHTRFKALRQLGVTEINCIIADLEPQKAKSYRIADNKTSELSSWNADALIQELREIELPEMEIYFPETNLNKLIQMSTGTVKWQEVTAESITNAALNELQSMNKLSSQREAKTRCVMCPECGNEFEVT